MKKWHELSMADKADVMKIAVRNGITTLSDIRSKYNEFAEGGEIVEPNSYPNGGLINAPAMPIIAYNEYKKDIAKQGTTGNNLFDFTLWYARKNGTAKKYKGSDEDLHYRNNLYNVFDPTSGYPGSLGKAIDFKVAADEARSEKDLPYTRKFVEPLADAAWAKRLNLPYDNNLLISNDDGSVHLADKYEREIPVDTIFLKQRIENNQNLLKSYERNHTDSQARRDAINRGIKYDTEALNSLRHTYETGEPVVLNEHSHNSRKWIDDGIVNIGITPLSLLQNYTVRYNKDKNEMEYQDIYDFNQFEDFIPGNPFTIRGSIKLNKKK